MAYMLNKTPEGLRIIFYVSGVLYHNSTEKRLHKGIYSLSKPERNGWTLETLPCINFKIKNLNMKISNRQSHGCIRP